MSYLNTIFSITKFMSDLNTIFTEAVLENNIDVVIFLLRKIENIKPICGKSTILSVIKNVAMFELLIKHNMIDLKSFNDGESFPAYDLLEHASSNNQIKIIKILLKHTTFDINGICALNISIHKNHYDCVKIFLNNPRVNINPAISHYSPFQAILYEDRHKILKLLLKDDRLDPSFDNNYLIWRASKSGNYKVVKVLLKDTRIDPCANNNRAIFSAVKNRSYGVVKLLLNYHRIQSNIDLVSEVIVLIVRDHKPNIIKEIIPYVDFDKLNLSTEIRNRILQLCFPVKFIIESEISDTEKAQAISKIAKPLVMTDLQNGKNYIFFVYEY